MNKLILNYCKKCKIYTEQLITDYSEMKASDSELFLYAEIKCLYCGIISKSVIKILRKELRI